MIEFCRVNSLRMIKEADQFGAIFRPTIKLKTSQYKTLIGGVISILIYGLSFTYFVYGIQLWATNQILPSIIDFNEVNQVINYKSSNKVASFKPFADAGLIDPFNSSNIVLMVINYKYNNGHPISNMRRIKQINGQMVIDNVDLKFDNRDENNPTIEESYTFLTNCIPQLLETGEQCAQNNIIKQFWNQANIMIYRLHSQQYNTESRQLTQLTKQFYVLYNQNQTFINNLQLQKTSTNVDQGVLFPDISVYEFISDISQQSQSLGIEQVIKLYGIPIYICFAVRMDTLSRQQNIAFANISAVLANIGSIISSLLFFSYIAVIINQKGLEAEAIMDVIKMFFPEFQQIIIKKNWFGRITSIQNQQTNLYYNVSEYNQYYNKLAQIAEQKLCISNQIYELSRLQFAVQQILNYEELIKLRDKTFKISIQPRQIKEKDMVYLKQPSFSQIVRILQFQGPTNQQDSRIIEVVELKDDELLQTQKNTNIQDLKTNLKENTISIQKHTKNDNNEQDIDEASFDLFCITRNHQQINLSQI